MLNRKKSALYALGAGCGLSVLALSAACGSDDAVQPTNANAWDGTASAPDAGVALSSFFGEDQGMWPYDRIPRDQIQKAHPELDLNDEFLLHLRNASAPLGNCSASFVSKDGLLMTNQHCMRDAVAALVTESFDPLNNGYFAADLAGEKVLSTAPSVSIIQSISDVTAPMLQGLAGLTESARDGKIAENKKPLEAACMNGLSEDQWACTVIGRDGNSVFSLYKKRVYKDVRLVGVAPAAGAGVAASMLPYDFPNHWHADFAFLRVYENGAPLQSADYLSWSTESLKEGDTLLFSGTPSETNRGWSLPGYEYIRDKRYGDWADRRGEALASLTAALSAASVPSDRAALQAAITSNKDSFDTFNDARAGMSRPEANAAKLAMEQYVEGQIAADPVRFAEFQNFFPNLKANLDKLTLDVIKHYRTMEGWQLSDGGTWAFYLTKLADQLALPDADREASYHEAEFDDYWGAYLTGDNDPNKAVDAALWRAWLARVEREFAAESDVVAILAEKSREARITELLGSDMYTKAKRKAVYDSIVATHGAMLSTTTDPALVLMRQLLPAEKRALAAFNAASFDPYPAGAISTRAHRAVFGDAWPTESNGDLRLSVGRVKRFSADGQPVQIATTFKSMFDFVKLHANESGYELPKLWTDNEALFSTTAQFVVSHNADTYKGNSGSPVITATGKVVGVHYGANPQSESRAYVFLNLQERNMLTSTQAIEEVLKVHSATALLAEVRAGHR